MMTCPNCNQATNAKSPSGAFFCIVCQKDFWPLMAAGPQQGRKRHRGTNEPAEAKSPTEGNVERLEPTPAGGGYQRPAKYGNRKTEVDGILFDSAKEANRYRELKLMAAAGEITLLTLQPVYDLIVDGVKVGKYRADFSYIRNNEEIVTEDVKGFKTAVYKLKKRIFEALYGKLTEV